MTKGKFRSKYALSLCVIALMLAVATLAVSAETEGYYTYNITDGEATITHVATSISGDVTIPSALGGYPVTVIGDSAFVSCDELSNVTIHDSVTRIGDYAFIDCNNLTDIMILSTDVEFVVSKGYTFGDTATIYGYTGSTAEAYAEEYGRPFEAIDIGGTCGAEGNEENLKWGFNPDTGTFVIYGTGAMADYTTGGAPWYEYRNGIESIVVFEGVTSIGAYAFEVCPKPTSMTIPSSITFVGSYGLTGCTAMKDIYITDLAAWCRINFDGNPREYSLYINGELATHVTIPEEITSLERTFRNCVGLESVTIHDGVTAITNAAFENCRSLKKVEIPDSVITIGYDVFKKCTALKSATIGNGVSSIGKNAFVDCIKLTSITINSVDVSIFDLASTISETATIYGYSDSTAEAYAEKYNRTFVSLNTGYCGAEGDGGNLTWEFDPVVGVLTVSGTGTMADYKANQAPWMSFKNDIKTVVIDEGVTYIGSYAFYNCGALVKVQLPSTVQKLGNVSF